MNLRVLRKTFSDRSTIGQLFVDGVFECFTLEDVVREVKGKPVSAWKVPGKTAIPYRAYEVVLDYSNRFKRVMPHILDVPGFEGIRIHSGNTAEHTDGCVLVGDELGVDFVGKSKVAFDRLYAKLEKAKDISILFTYLQLVDKPQEGKDKT